MENTQQTKVRLIREAIDENIETAKRIRTRIRARPRRAFPVWLCGCLLVAALAYLSLPPQVISRGTTTPLDPPKQEWTDPPAVVVNQAAQAEIHLSAPHPLNRSVFPLSVNRVVVDPGHGGRHTGAISESGISEKEITLDIALRLRRLMEKASFEVLMTRETDQTMSLEKRVAFANANNADLFVSIHINWMEPRRIRPLETYFVGPTDDPAAIKLVSMENQDSGYSLADYRQLLEKVYIHTRRDESRRLAETIHTELYYSLREVNPEIDNRGVRTAPFIVLVGTEMPAILVEVSSLSNEDEVKLLTSADYREKIAMALLRGIRSYAGGLKSSNMKGS
jgi:N-acetylmuramoyl-L-alanine amidase